MSRRIEAYVGIAAGIAAPVVYAGAVISGGAATPGYSHLVSTISELTIAGQPYAEQLDDIFVAYNLLLACFAAALPANLPNASRRAGYVAAAALLVLAVAGVGMATVFPAGAMGAPVSPSGWVHIALAAVASLSTMIAVAIIAIALWRAPRRRALARFSLVCLALIAVSGAWAASAVADGWTLAGLAERATIGTFMVWLFVFATSLARGDDLTGRAG